MSAVVPVETILKIEEDESSHRVDCLQNAPPVLISVGIQCTPLEDSSQQNSPTLSNDAFRRNIPQSHGLEDGANEPVFMRPWPSPLEASIYQNHKIPDTCNYSKPYYPSNLQPLSYNDNTLLQVDYRTRNKIKTKQRREDPYYRDQERVRQRTVMQLKRQDPCFRAAEREKGRCRMRLKRLDPVFRTQERERQRERMKQKRQDPNFRERERELQKNRIQGKRLDPDYREKERAHDRVRMRLKRNSSLETFIQVEGSPSENFEISEALSSNLETPGQPCKAEGHITKPPTFDGLNNVKPLIPKLCENTADSLQYRTSRFFNLHICSDNKDAWHNAPEKLTKATLLFNMFRDDINPQTSSVNQNNAFMSKSHGTNNEIGKKGQQGLTVSQLLAQHNSVVVAMDQSNMEAVKK